MLFPLGENLPFPGKTGPSSRVGTPLPLSCFNAFGHRHTTLNSVVRTHSVHILYINQRRCKLTSSTFLFSRRNKSPFPPAGGFPLFTKGDNPKSCSNSHFPRYLSGGRLRWPFSASLFTSYSLSISIVTLPIGIKTQVLPPYPPLFGGARWGLDHIPRPCRPKSDFAEVRIPNYSIFI